MERRRYSAPTYATVYQSNPTIPSPQTIMVSQPSPLVVYAFVYRRITRALFILEHSDDLLLSSNNKVLIYKNFLHMLVNLRTNPKNNKNLPDYFNSINEFLESFCSGYKHFDISYEQAALLKMQTDYHYLPDEDNFLLAQALNKKKLINPFKLQKIRRELGLIPSYGLQEFRRLAHWPHEDFERLFLKSSWVKSSVDNGVTSTP